MDAKLLVESVEDMLKDSQFAEPAVALLMHFPGLQVVFAPFSRTTQKRHCSFLADEALAQRFLLVTNSGMILSPRSASYHLLLHNF